MNRYPALCLGILLATVHSAPLYAEDVHNMDEERIEHYESKTIHSADAASEALAKYADEVMNILSKDTFSPQDFERIHEVSYTLEEAVDVLQNAESNYAPATVAALQQTIETLHYASEDHAVDRTKDAATALKHQLQQAKLASVH